LNKDLIIKPIGIVKSALEKRYETPRQGVLAGKDISTINLYPQNNFEQAVKDLEGFERIWVIYLFHLNKNWKPIITPPRNAEKKVGVFATRAPYRPNPIGLSCVKLEKIEGPKIYISESDLLNGTPVIDIKPYLPYSDSFPNVSTGWVKTDLKNIHKVKFTKKAEKKILKLLNDENINLKNYALVQLEFNPTDTSRKRISEIQTLSKSKVKNDSFSLAYRDWRIIYSADIIKKVVTIRDIVFVKALKINLK
jgi:tRNA-Thr(GGU) m(6)t(6)A37 methyltransferase TsaA